ncbi:MAG: sensor histidine kinase [Bacilli bacterium]|nr:sensor histidine kinase [Bacilli bacterium]
MARIGNLFFGLELLLGEAMFLYAAPKRKYFPFRLTLAVILFGVICYFYPIPQPYAYEIWFLIIRFLSLFLVTALLSLVCFDISVSSALSLCGAGYAVQHIAYQLSNILFQTDWFTNPDWGHLIAEAIVFPIIYAGAFFLIAKNAAKTRHYDQIDYRFDLIAITVLLVCVVLSRFTRTSTDKTVIISSGLYAITCCTCALVIQFYLRKSLALSKEKQVIENLWDKDKKHYELSKENMEILNIKAHDLKHKLSMLGEKLPADEIASMKKVIDAYDSHLKTGNDALDVILNEKNNNCLAKKISFTFLGSGKNLDFMDIMDMYSLLGNALDNAIEAVDSISDPSMRVITMNIEEKGDAVFIVVRNYSSKQLTIVDGLPQSSKAYESGYHGYGLKSMKRLAQKYEGDITFQQKGEVFTLTVFLNRNALSKEKVESRNDS